MTPERAYRSRILLLLIASFVVAGCVDRASEPPASPTPTEAKPSKSTAQSNNATSCTRVFLVVPVDRLHAQSYLPDGFGAAEASRFFGQASYPAGTGLLSVSAMRCASSEWSPQGYVEGMVGIFVDPPIIDGRRVEGEHFYELGRAAPSDQPYGATLRASGWTLIGDRIDVTHESMPTHSGQAELRDANGTVFSASVPAAPVPDDFTGELRIRWWQRTPSGMGFFEYVFEPDGFLGTGACQARAGSIAAQVLESTTCPEALFMVGPPFDVAGRFEFKLDLVESPST